MVKITLVACLLFVANSIFSQATFIALGGEATGSGGSSSYTVGQLIYITSAESNGTLDASIQQSFELLTLSTKELTPLKLTAFAYPNPTVDNIVLALKNSNLIGLTYVIYDTNGQLVTSGKVRQKTTRITMQHLPAGVYILKVNQNNQALKIFKIIKK